jgi:hypothetical protein
MPRLRTLLWIAPAALVAAGGAYAAMMMQPPPADLDLALAKPTDHGLYVGALEPGLSPLEINRMHSWTITVTAPDGTPVDNAAIAIDGGMPQHGHGLPTAPQVTRALGEGRYLIEGMKFNMDGWWTIDVEIDGPAGSDAVTYNLVL